MLKKVRFVLLPGTAVRRSADPVYYRRALPPLSQTYFASQFSLSLPT